MSKSSWMIYGGYGYTGELIAREASAKNLNPILAGRDREKLVQLSRRLKLPYRCFGLNDISEMVSHLKDVSILLNCAGPFTQTAVPLVKACLKTVTAYLDITGEIEVFEYMARLHSKAQKTGAVICPGVGFDVIPTDCLAAIIKETLSHPKYLSLAFDARGSFSRGTAITAVDGFKYNGRVRKKGAIVQVPLAYKVRKIDFGRGLETAVTIPWGDVSTAYYSTKIPNIVVYKSVTEKELFILRLIRFLRPVLGMDFVREFFKAKIRERMTGPSLAERKSTGARVWAEVSDDEGRLRQARLTTANPYDVTVSGAIGVVEKLLGEPVRPGFYTPSKLMGPHYISRLPGSTRVRIELSGKTYLKKG